MARIVGSKSFILLPVLCLIATTAAAATADRDLERIKNKIEKEKEGITQAQRQESSVLHSLARIGEELEQKTRELSQTNARLKSVSSEMRKKQAEAERIGRSLQQRKKLLERRAVALYRFYRGGSPLIVLNGDLSPPALTQRNHYLARALEFDRELIEALQDEAAQHEILQNELAGKREELATLKRDLAEGKRSVRREAENKRVLLASLRQEKQSRVRAVKELEQAALRLQKMIDEMAKAPPSRNSDRAGAEAEMGRGKLEWPVRGELISSFGKTKHREFSAEVFRKGIDIEAPVGEQVRAAEKGRVVFADRFSGYGKMVIIDHGERFYTVYAHLSEFLKKNGDLVKRGEPIGLAGDSDSLAGAKLYFELRKDGRSIDPLPWLRKP